MSEVSEDGKGELDMEYISVHCRDCGCDFDLEINEHGCALGVCNCEEISEDLGLEDTALEDAISIYDDFIVKMPPIKQHTQKVKIKSIKRGTPNIIEFDYIEEKKRSESK